MPLNLPLTPMLRELMLRELDLDLEANRLYLSPRLTPLGREEYPDLLRAAIGDADEVMLADCLSSGGLIASRESYVRGGVRRTKKVPWNAHLTLAEGEFGHYYARAVCLAAIERGLESVRVFRAKAVANPRPRSLRLEGTFVDAESLLGRLRSRTNEVIGVPAGPSSGLNVRLPEASADPSLVLGDPEATDTA